MAELKTKKTTASVAKFIGSLPAEQMQSDCRQLAALMQQATGAAPKMWGQAIVGFGDFHYRYASGREGDWFQLGFSPRKQALTLYIMCGFGRDDVLMRQLGKYKTGVACIYIKRLADLHLPTLKKLLRIAVKEMRKIQKKYRAGKVTDTKPSRTKRSQGVARGADGMP